MFDIAPLIEKSLIYISDTYPLLFGSGSFLLALIAMSTIALTLVLITCAVWMPFRIARTIFDYIRDM